MDPATERMLARARARRQKLDAQLKDFGLETSSKRAPLQESNTQFVKVTTEVEVVLNSSDSVQKVNVSPTKVEIHNSGEKENLLKPSGDKQMSDLKKRENDVMLSSDSKSSYMSAVESSPKAEKNIRSQLKRLGALYSDEQISSPIHRTENKFAVETEFPTKTTKPTARVARLAALADNIKQWEDDLSHPVFNTKGCNKEEVKHANVLVPNEEVCLGDRKKDKSDHKLEQDRTITNRKEIPAFEQNKQSYGCTSQNVSPKKMVWDEKVLQLLDDVNEISSRSKGPLKSSEKTFSKKKNMVECNEKQEYVAGGGIISGTTQWVGDGPVFPVKKCTSDKNSPKFVANSSPTKGLGSPVKLPPGSPKAGSVLEKASMFESSSPTKKTKDPAELPLSERMALFERNKGQALIPKAAFSMAVPAKYLESGAKKAAYSPEKAKALKENEDQKASGNKSDSNICNKVLSCREIFERGVSNDIKDRVVNEQISRQNELDMLRNRWNKNKTLATDTEDMKRILPDPVLQTVVPPPPPPPPCDMSPTKTFALPQITHMIPKCPGSNNQSPTKKVHQESPRKPLKLSPKINERSEICKMRKIKVSPPKPGHIYPCLSDIDATTTEAESEIGDETERDSDSSVTDDSDNRNTSFGREILEAAGINNKNNYENQPAMPMDSSNSDLSESADMSDIGGCIDEALKGYDSSSESDNEGPTPPKKGRGYLHSPQKGKSSSKSPNSKPSQSFKYTPGSSINSSPSKSPEKYHRCEVPLESNQETPLMHSVSFYRKQQNLSVKNTPVRQIVRPPETVVKMESEPVPQTNEEAIRMKITELLEEVSKQQIIISQASQALNLCMATVEFSGSAEQVEGERLLLLATHKRQAALHEVQRLKVEGSLKPVSEADPNASFNRGSLMITNICLSMKKDCVRRLPSEEICYHFMCLVRSQDQVLGTQVLAGIPQNLQDGCNLVWNSPLRLVNLYSDFKVTLEVYSLQTRREILPHNVKYHIGGKKDTGKSWRTPKKQKQESLLVMPTLNSPAGPSAVRSPEFRMAGYVVFSLREINRNHFTLNKVSYSSPLEGSIQVKMKSELSVDVCERGFLTMFEDVSGFGAWHRRWFVLKGSVLAYWKYPDDERKIPIGQIDLDTCSTTNVNLVSRDICARPNTFLLETVRPAQPDDKDSLVMITSGDTTTIRVLLSADTKEERLLWCAQINKALSLIRAWGSK